MHAAATSGGALAFVLGSWLTAGAEEIAPQHLDGTIRWVYDYEKGKALSRSSGKPLFVVFRCER